MTKRILSSLAIIPLLIISGCGSGEAKVKQTKSGSNVNETSIAVSTSAEQGGYGFEKVAESLGYKTYVLSEKDGTFFGDPNAVKGGTLHYIHSNFPRTLRIIGQNSSQMINSRIIERLCYEALLGQHPATLEFVPGLATHW